MSRDDFKYYFLVIDAYSKGVETATTKKERDYFCSMLSSYICYWNKVKHMFSENERDEVDRRLVSPRIKEVFLEYLLKHSINENEYR